MASEVRETSDAWFAARLRHERVKRGLSQQEIANRLAERGIELHASAVAKIESGARAVRIGEALAFAAIFEQSVESLSRPPAGDWADVYDALTEALRLYRTARLLEASAIGRMRALTAAFGDEGKVALAAPELQGPVVELLAQIGDFMDRKVEEEDSDARRLARGEAMLIESADGHFVVAAVRGGSSSPREGRQRRGDG